MFRRTGHEKKKEQKKIELDNVTDSFLSGDLARISRLTCPANSCRSCWSLAAILTLTFMGQNELSNIDLSFLMIRLVTSESRGPVGLRHSTLAELSIHREVLKWNYRPIHYCIHHCSTVESEIQEQTGTHVLLKMHDALTTLERRLSILNTRASEWLFVLVHRPRR